MLGRLGDRVIACTTEPGPGGPRSRAYPDFHTGPADTLATDGMFAVWLPVSRLQPDAKGHVKAWDARGTVVYDGMLPLF